MHYTLLSFYWKIRTKYRFVRPFVCISYPFYCSCTHFFHRRFISLLLCILSMLLEYNIICIFTTCFVLIIFFMYYFNFHIEPLYQEWHLNISKVYSNRSYIKSNSITKIQSNFEPIVNGSKSEIKLCIDNNNKSIFFNLAYTMLLLDWFVINVVGSRYD